MEMESPELSFRKCGFLNYSAHFGIKLESGLARRAYISFQIRPHRVSSCGRVAPGSVPLPSTSMFALALGLGPRCMSSGIGPFAF